MRTYAKIIKGDIAFPLHFTRSASDLIRALLNPKPTKRLGITSGGAAQIKKHAWVSQTADVELKAQGAIVQ